MKDHNIKGFYTLNQAETFEEGAKNCLTMSGLGKLSPNMLLMGFKSDWKQNIQMSFEYLNTIYCAFDQRLSLTILRVQGGFDYSDMIAEEKTVTKEVPVTEHHSDDEGKLFFFVKLRFNLGFFILTKF